MSTEESENKNEESPEVKEAEIVVGSIFDSHKMGQDRVNNILKTIEPVLNSKLFDKDDIIQRLNSCASIEDRENFIKETVLILNPLIILREQDPEAFRKLATRAENQESEKFIEINDVFSYNEIDNSEGGKSFLIHLPVNDEKRRRLGLLGIGKLFEKGMQELAEITSEREDVGKIEATSRLVKKYQRLMRNLGFTVTGEIDEELRKKHFADQNPGDVYHAEISRQDFLKKYLKKHDK